MIDRQQALFSDRVFSSTYLNRNSREVLNQARLSPVTISRNDEQFALLLREDAAKLIQDHGVLLFTVNLLRSIFGAMQKQAIPQEMDWLRKFDTEDLGAFANEILESTTSAATTWNVYDIVHAWKETASLMDSPVFEQALTAPVEPGIVLPEPESEHVGSEE